MADKKEKKYLIDNPTLMAEWNWEKNNELGLAPNTLTYGSGKKVWWKCSKGHEWQTVIKSRKNGVGCPYCANKKVLVGFNDLATLNPKLASEWHPTKNGSLSPFDVTIGSEKKVWWKCEKGHEWNTTIAHRIEGTGCPICSNKKVLVGYNDLATLNPKLANEWHPIKNGNLLPSNVTVSSNKKVWWQCKKGHEWKSSIANRTKGNKCPICSSELKTSFPEQVIYYYFNQITETINRHKIDNRTEIDIYMPKFKLGIEYDGIFYHNGSISEIKEKRKQERLNNLGIRLIRVKEVKNPDGQKPIKDVIYTGTQYTNENITKMLNDLIKYVGDITCCELHTTINLDSDRSKIYELYIYSNKDKALTISMPNLAKEWHPTKNGKLKPEYFTFGSNKKVWWKCEKGHEWQAVINSRKTGVGCPYCANKKVLVGFNDLATLNPELAKEWHPTKNGNLLPNDVTISSNKKVWWRCEKGHEWQATINDRNRGRGCPYCSGKKVLVGFNDLATTHPNIAKEWHSTKNGNLSTKDVTAGSNKKVWWLCSQCGYEWQSHIYDRKNEKGCKQCANLLRGNILRKKIYQYTIDGVFVAEYESITKAKKVTGIQNIYPYSEKRKTHGRYIWLEEKDDAFAHKIAETINSNKFLYKDMPVLQFTFSGELVARYNSSKQAEIINNISRSKVGECCRGKRKSAGGFVWKYDK